MKRVVGYYSIELGAGSDVGSVREQNEDAYHTLLGTGSQDELFDALLIVAVDAMYFILFSEPQRKSIAVS